MDRTCTQPQNRDLANAYFAQSLYKTYYEGEIVAAFSKLHTWAAGRDMEQLGCCPCIHCSLASISQD